MHAYKYKPIFILILGIFFYMYNFFYLLHLKCPDIPCHLPKPEQCPEFGGGGQLPHTSYAYGFLLKWVDIIMQS